MTIEAPQINNEGMQVRREKKRQEKFDKKIQELEDRKKQLRKRRDQLEYSKIHEELTSAESEPREIENADVATHKNRMVQNGLGNLVENLDSVAGFKNLTDGQKMLVADDINHTLLRHIENEGQKRFYEEIAPYQINNWKENFSKKGYTNIWKNLTRGYRVARHTKDALHELKSSHEDYADTREAFLQNNVTELVQVYSESNLGAHLGGKDGKQVISEYAKFEGNDNEIQKINEDWNAIASNPAPYEWGLRDATKKQKAAYLEYRAKYEETKARYSEKLIEYIEAHPDEPAFKNTTPESYAANHLNDAETKMESRRFLITNPDASREIRRVANRNPGARAIMKSIKEHGPLIALGYELRNVVRGLDVVMPGLGTTAVTAVGAGIGFFKGEKIGKKIMREKNSLLRFGVRQKPMAENHKITAMREQIEGMRDSTDKPTFQALMGEFRKIVEAENKKREKNETNAGVGNIERHLTRISSTTENLLNETNPEERAKLLKDLKTYVDFAEAKLALGELNFGKTNRFYNQYQLTRDISRAKIEIGLCLQDTEIQNIFGGDFSEHAKENMFQKGSGVFKNELNTKIQSRGMNEAERIDTAQKLFIDNQKRKGAFYGAVAAFGGSMLRNGLEYFGIIDPSHAVGLDFLKQQALGLEHLAEKPAHVVMETVNDLYKNGEKLWEKIHHTTHHAGGVIKAPVNDNFSKAILEKDQADFAHANTHTDVPKNIEEKLAKHHGVHKPRIPKPKHTEFPTKSVLAKNLKTPEYNFDQPLPKIPDNSVEVYQPTADELHNIDIVKNAAVKNSLDGYFPKTGFLGNHGIHSQEWKAIAEKPASDFMKGDYVSDSPYANMQHDIQTFVKDLKIRAPYKGESLEQYYEHVQQMRASNVIVEANTQEGGIKIEGHDDVDDQNNFVTRAGKKLSKIERKIDLGGKHSHLWREVKNQSASDFITNEPEVGIDDLDGTHKHELWADMIHTMKETGATPPNADISVKEYLNYINSLKQAGWEQSGVTEKLEALKNGDDITETVFGEGDVNKDIIDLENN